MSAESVTRMTPVVPVTQHSETPTTLSEVFEDAFPLTPKQPRPPPRSPPPPRPRPPAAAGWCCWPPRER
ncbi:hypothetical protein WKI68_15520 [Streptomyces sp. MS1.HAVA.3]|uniref:Uncharacterized protein n=1 Tax=Streptomyces caledonius TaxID=3134107 RepID=A0ABU8U4L2_9ACTN